MSATPFVCEEILLSETEFLDDGTVTLDVLVLKILQKVTSLTYHFEKSAAAVMVLLVDLKVLCQLVDPLCENCNLNLGRTCVALVDGIGCDDFLFDVFL